MRITLDKSTHRKIITAIHINFGNNEPFAIWELRDITKCSASSVVRTLARLVELDLVAHSHRGYMGKKYRMARRWPMTAQEAIENFEVAKVLGL